MAAGSILMDGWMDAQSFRYSFAGTPNSSTFNDLPTSFVRVGAVPPATLQFLQGDRYTGNRPWSWLTIRIQECRVLRLLEKMARPRYNSLGMAYTSARQQFWGRLSSRALLGPLLVGSGLSTM